MVSHEVEFFSASEYEPSDLKFDEVSDQSVLILSSTMEGFSSTLLLFSLLSQLFSLQKHSKFKNLERGGRDLKMISQDRTLASFS
jgi:hypothetical protein